MLCLCSSCLQRELWIWDSESWLWNEIIPSSSTTEKCLCYKKVPSIKTIASVGVCLVCLQLIDPLVTLPIRAGKISGKTKQNWLGFFIVLFGKSEISSRSVTLHVAESERSWVIPKPLPLLTTGDTASALQASTLQGKHWVHPILT